MSLSVLARIQDPAVASNSLNGAAQYRTNFYLAWSGTGKLRTYDITNFQNIATATTTNASVGEVAMIAMTTASPCAVMCYSSSATIDLIELNTGYKTSCTTNVQTVLGFSLTQQIAPNLNNGYALAIRSGQNSLTLYNSANNTASVLSPAILSAVNSRRVVAVGSHWVVATGNGKVFEIDSAGTVTTTITLPTTPNIATPSVDIMGLFYYAPYLLVITTSGIMYLYNWGTSTLVDTYRTYPQPPSGTTCAIAGANGYVLLKSSGSTYYGTGCSELYIGSGKIYLLDYTPFYDFASGTPGCIAYDGVTGKAVLATDSSAIVNGDFVQATPSIQAPIITSIASGGSLTSGRIVRIRRVGPGRSFVEVDQNISAVATSLPAVEGYNYIDIGISAGSADFCEESA